ncbi:hypothetical protein ACLOJK_036268 [Asimina triloba]
MPEKGGATTDPLAALDAVSPSECKVFDYLMKSAVCNQTREIIKEFLERSEQYNLAKAEKLNIINIRPSTTAEIFPEGFDLFKLRKYFYGVDNTKDFSVVAPFWAHLHN